MDHMDQKHQGTRSTKALTVHNTDDYMTYVPQTSNNNKNNHVYMTIINMAGKLYIEKTVSLPVTSNRGKSYVVIVYAVDSNYIKSYTIKLRHHRKLLK